MEGSEKEIRLRQAIGQADLCELLSVAFSFPNENLAQALANGTFVSDGIACMADVGADETSLEGGRQAMSHFGGRDVHELFGSMRKAYSLLYLAPGSDVKVFPYEAAFRFVAEGREGTPTLFRSPITLDVERFMAEAGVATIKGRTEPCDSIFEEYAFLSYLCAKRAEAIRTDDLSSETFLSAHLDSFVAQHASVWIPLFLKQTIDMCRENSISEEYAVLACFAGHAIRSDFPVLMRF